MKKLFLLTILILLFNNKSFAADNNGTGDADVYKVTVQKVELCQDSACATSTTVGDSSKTFDIASATAGSDVGSYASTSGLPLGTTFTHLRVTLSRTMTIKGTVTMASPGNCVTDGSTEAASDQLHLGALSGTAVETDLYLGDDSTYDKTDGSKTTGKEINIDYDSPTYAIDMTISGSSVLMIYKLTEAYTAKFKSPLIKIKFKTENALGAYRYDAATDICSMWPQEPLVEISLK